MEQKSHFSLLTCFLFPCLIFTFTALLLKSIPKTSKSFLFPFAKDRGKKKKVRETHKYKKPKRNSGEVCVIGQVFNLWNLAGRTRV